MASNIDIDQIQDFLSRRTAISPGHVQDDPSLFFEYLFCNQNSLCQFEVLINGINTSHDQDAMIRIAIDTSVPNATFEQSFASCFDYKTDEGMHKQCFFSHAPENLLIQIKRFMYSRDSNSSSKITEAIKTPEKFQFPTNFLMTAENVTYQCNAFLVHIGENMDSGHYVSYIRSNNIWWFCSDTQVRQASKQEALNAMNNSYIMHYAKIY